MEYGEGEASKDTPSRRHRDTRVAERIPMESKYTRVRAQTFLLGKQAPQQQN